MGRVSAVSSRLLSIEDVRCAMALSSSKSVDAHSGDCGAGSFRSLGDDMKPTNLVWCSYTAVTVWMYLADIAHHQHVPVPLCPWNVEMPLRSTSSLVIHIMVG